MLSYAGAVPLSPYMSLQMCCGSQSWISRSIWGELTRTVYHQYGAVTDWSGWLRASHWPRSLSSARSAKVTARSVIWLVSHAPTSKSAFLSTYCSVCKYSVPGDGFSAASVSYVSHWIIPYISNTPSENYLLTFPAVDTKALCSPGNLTSS